MAKKLCKSHVTLIRKVATKLAYKQKMDSTQLIKDGAIATDGKKYEENLVCVVDNGPFAAAGYCFSEEEYNVFSHPSDSRRKRWIIHPKAKELAK